MRLSQKRTCNGCRAYWARGREGRCELGFKNRVAKGAHLFVSHAPAEPCYKPLTNEEYFQANQQEPDDDVDPYLQTR